MSDITDELELVAQSIDDGNASVCRRAVARIAELEAAQTWRPMDSCPAKGEFLVATYAPTNWSYSVQTVVLQPELPARHREMQLRYARAWLPLPEPPNGAP